MVVSVTWDWGGSIYLGRDRFAGHKATLRGAIGYGDLIYDANSIWVGSAIEDAYVAASSQVWSGYSFTSACGEFYQQMDILVSIKIFLILYLLKKRILRNLKNLGRSKNEL